MLSVITFTPALVLPGLRPAAAPSSSIAMTELWQRRGFGGPMPDGILKEDAAVAVPRSAVKNSLSIGRPEMLAAIFGVAACSTVGYAVSSAQADAALNLLGAADLYNSNVLYTDLLIKGLDAANAAGLLALPLAIAYYATSLRAAEAEAEAEWACVVSELAEEVCGVQSFDSTDAMMCVEGSDGRWVCA